GGRPRREDPGRRGRDLRDRLFERARRASNWPRQGSRRPVAARPSAKAQSDASRHALRWHKISQPRRPHANNRRWDLELFRLLFVTESVLLTAALDDTNKRLHALRIELRPRLVT